MKAALLNGDSRRVEVKPVYRFDRAELHPLSPCNPAWQTGLSLPAQPQGEANFT